MQIKRNVLTDSRGIPPILCRDLSLRKKHGSTTIRQNLNSISGSRWFSAIERELDCICRKGCDHRGIETSEKMSHNGVLYVKLRICSLRIDYCSRLLIHVSAGRCCQNASKLFKRKDEDLNVN
ncbi:hypothetical protein LAZ67_16000037 [Cordylochernes scorpioides]|uniref:Uncharacterized protein n=1 Tax=Cordylochernes scorpioides TaxID=51811 RepID=A0ABY6LAA5_9ARAC|nr:hypothetical protein LAZ67_16000037 [Cordylochernes scorpioides]